MLIKYSNNFLAKKNIIEQNNNLENDLLLEEDLLLEARIFDINKSPIKMDSYMKTYLYKIDPKFWKQAIFERFELLYEALEKREEVRKKEYDKKYDTFYQEALKSMQDSPILQHASDDVKRALVLNTAHKKAMQKVAEETDDIFWNGVGKKYNEKMDFEFTTFGNRKESYQSNPNIKSLLDSIEGKIGEKGIDLTNPHLVKIERIKDKDTGEIATTIKKRTNGFEFPEVETIKEVLKDLLQGVANGLLSSSIPSEFLEKDLDNKYKKYKVDRIPTSAIFTQKGTMDDNFAFTHERKRTQKKIKNILTSYLPAYLSASSETKKFEILSALINDLKRAIPFFNQYNCNDYKSCKNLFNQVTDDSNMEMYKNAFEINDKNLLNPNLGNPDQFFKDEALLRTLSSFLAVKQILIWAKEGKLKTSSDEQITFDEKSQKLIFPELKLPVFKKNISFKEKQQEKKGGQYVDNTKDVYMPVLFDGGFTKEHEEGNIDHESEHENLPRRGFLHNPLTGKKEHRFVSVDSWSHAGHQGYDHDRVGAFHPTQNMTGVEFLDIQDPEIKNLLEKLIREEGLCTYTMSINDDGSVNLDIKDNAKYTDKNTVLCGVAKAIKNNLMSSRNMDKRNVKEESKAILRNFPIMYKIVVLNLLNNLNSDMVIHPNKRKALISRIVTDFKQKNIGGKGTRRLRQEGGGIEALHPFEPVETKNEMLNLIAKLKHTLLKACDSRDPNVCRPCNPEDYTCEIKASYDIPYINAQAEKIDAKVKKAERNLNASNLENYTAEINNIKTMLTALAVANELSKKKKTTKSKLKTSELDTSILDKSKEIDNMFISEEGKNKSMVEIVKDILNSLGITKNV